jgi:multiple antibiotic resistance protein
MNEVLQSFLLAWLPLFVAMDPIGLVPMFLALTEGMSRQERAEVATQATITAAVVSIAFVVLGQALLQALGVTVSDFQIAGGLILFMIAARDILGITDSVSMKRLHLGVVPLGTPLIAGPATLTALLMIMKQQGILMTLLAFAVNLFLVWLAFRQCDRLVRLLGLRALQAFSKIVSLFLTAYAISMIRRGLQTL